MEVEFYNIGEIDDKKLEFAVICANYEEKWIFVRHRQRVTWEIPGGHREKKEDINDTANRELFEETGARTFEIVHICDYSVTNGNITSYGRLCYAEVSNIGELPESEIKEIRLFEDIPEALTYPEIQPILLMKILRVIKELEE